jgi:hypothetical protein
MHLDRTPEVCQTTLINHAFNINGETCDAFMAIDLLYDRQYVTIITD